MRLPSIPFDLQPVALLAAATVVDPSGRFLPDATEKWLLGAGGVLVSGFLWTALLRPAIDAFVLAALARRRVEFEKYLRADLFRDDIAARDQRGKEINEALRLAREANEMSHAAQQAIEMVVAQGAATNESIATVATLVRDVAEQLAQMRRAFPAATRDAVRDALLHGSYSPQPTTMGDPNGTR